MKNIDIMEFIPTGQENAITRRELRNTVKVSDRHLRELIEEARESNVIINLSDGIGYFQPLESELDLVERYLMQEVARINKIEKSIKYARFKFGGYNGSSDFTSKL